MSTTTHRRRADGPTPTDIGPPPHHGDGTVLPQPAVPLPDGYVEHELFVAGTATRYTSADEPADGHWQATPAGEAPYRTRVLVRRPTDPATFSGTVIVEWFNVSAIEASPDWAYLATEIGRAGHAYIGVSAQAQGVEGGATLLEVDVDAEAARATHAVTDTTGLRHIDPERYGTLTHPGDAYAFDIFTQVGRAAQGPGGERLLGDLHVTQVLAVGESQSAIFLSTVANALHPVTPAFDAFLVHSRGATVAPLDGDFTSVRTLDPAEVARRAVRIRTDLDVPVFVFEAETDLTLLAYAHARQPDTDRIRTWEVAGTAHADRGLIGPVADSLDCGAPINDGPHGFAVRSALRHLDTWVRTGEAPPTMPQLEIDESGDSPAIARDADGIALGGIRYPVVDVPVQVLSGDPGPAPDIICLLTGTTNPMPAERLAELYTSPDAYTAAFTAATDAAIATGALLAEDRQAMQDEAQPELLKPEQRSRQVVSSVRRAVSP
ncbi:MAG: alpha/beta hydrolase domain-containing protein [Acidimicrobiales bacterium]